MGSPLHNARRFFTGSATWAVVLLLALLATPGWGQGLPATLPAGPTSIPTTAPDFQSLVDLLHNRVPQPITLAHSGVSLLDAAVPATLVRLRYDAGFRFQQPDRGEWFWAQTSGRGPAASESRVDYQDLAFGVEYALSERFSLFADLPLRWVNPETNPNHGGLADGSAGFKLALWQDDGMVVSYLTRVTFPSGSGRRGLGNRHVSLEPGLIGLWRIGEALSWEAELTDVVPLGGTPGFAGNIIRYGTGVTYLLTDAAVVRTASVIEVVGWTFTGGDVTFQESAGVWRTRSTAGDTILNSAAGVRIQFWAQHSLYVGYVQALTNERFYNNLLRVEYRRTF